MPLLSGLLAGVMPCATRIFNRCSSTPLPQEATSALEGITPGDHGSPAPQLAAPSVFLPNRDETRTPRLPPSQASDRT